jgi:RsiW-degrading membrane proteinase PrsW (M82 family)
MSVFIGFILAIIIPLFFLGIIHALDFYRTGQLKFILLCLGWGGIAYALGGLINNLLFVSKLTDWDTIIRVYAPIHEEVFKGLILLFWVRRPKFYYFVDGAIYGFAAGIGFAIFENFESLFNNSSITDIFIRTLSTNLIHATGSAAIGIAFGLFRLETSRSRWQFSVAGLCVAIGQHMFFNNMIRNEVSSIVTFIPGFLGLAFVYFAMQRGKQQAQRWIRQKLGMDDRVTRGEVAMVDRLDGTDDVLIPVVERFGAETTSQVEKFLYLQARLGIKRKALESFQKDAMMRNAMEVEINKIRAEMDEVRRAVGIYAMLFVRGLFTDEMASVWEQMQAKIQERSAVTGGRKGGGLWASLEERVKAPTDSERLE